MDRIQDVGVEGEVDLLALARALRDGRRRVLTVAFATLAVGTLLAFVLPEQFESTATVMAASAKTAGGLGQFADLASMAGVDLPGGGGASQPLAVLKSESLLRELIEEKNLLPVLFRSRWDADAGRWSVTGDRVPDFRDGIEKLGKIRTVSDDKKSGLVTIKVRWRDRDQAAEWCNELIRLTNARMRREAIEQSESSIKYLTDELQKNENTSVQQATSRVIESQMEKMTFAKANEQFAFRVVDTAVPARRRAFPKRLVFVLGSAVLGLLAGALAEIARRRLRPRRGSSGATAD